MVVANGNRVACRGLARDIAILIANEHFIVDCYAIPLNYYDVVLGVSYLPTLGPILWISTTSTWPFGVMANAYCGRELGQHALAFLQRAISTLSVALRPTSSTAC